MGSGGEDGKEGARRRSQAARAGEEEVENYVHKDAACKDGYNAEGFGRACHKGRM